VGGDGCGFKATSDECPAERSTVEISLPKGGAARAGLPIGMSGTGLERRGAGLTTGWEGVNAAGGTPPLSRISEARWDVGLAQDPVMLDAGKLGPKPWGLVPGRAGEALVREIKPRRTSPTRGEQGLGLRPKQGLSRTIRGN
jgi:hypothetical protein